MTFLKKVLKTTIPLHPHSIANMGPTKGYMINIISFNNGSVRNRIQDSYESCIQDSFKAMHHFKSKLQLKIKLFQFCL